MGKLARLSTARQVILIFALICAILVATGIFFFLSLRTLERHDKQLQSQILHELALSNDLSRSLNLEQVEVYRFVQANGEEERKRHEQIISSLKEANAKRWRDYGTLVDNPTEVLLNSEALLARQIYWQETEALLILNRTSVDSAAKDLGYARQTVAYEKYQGAILDIADWTEKEAGQMSVASSDLLAYTIKIGDALIALSLMVTIGTGFALVRITRQLKHDNLALQESEEKFRQLAENITDVFWIASPGLQKTTYVSPAFESVWGRSCASVYSHPQEWSDAILPEYREQVLAEFSKLEIGTLSVSAEFQIVRPDGEVRWIHSRGYPVRDSLGNLVRLIGIASDITERKKTEETLQLLNFAILQSKESILITDAQLDMPGPKIIFVNPAFTTMTGYTADEVVGKTPRILQGPRTDKTVLGRLRQNLEAGGVFAGEAINYRKDGTEFDLEWQVAPIRHAARTITHFVAIQRDITERKRIETRLLQSQKMETVGKLAGGVAHEFNSILTAIIGQSELLLSDLPNGSPLIASAQEIQRAADRAAVLTRQLLAYGRRQTLQPEILDLNKVLNDMVGTLQHLVGREVSVKIVPALDLKLVRIDPDQMEQVIVNLAMNAADAMPNGGRLTLETSNITLEDSYVAPYPGLAAGEYVMIAITDTGIGMSEEVKARAFEPFFSTKGVGQGTGLGLATCYGILKQSNGHINVYSEVSRGSTFKLYLPQTQLNQSPHPAAPAEMPRGTESILLAEDDPSLREMSATLLRRLGYTVITAVNGVEALGLRNQKDIGHIDLLFTDVVMPHMSGKELSERIRSIYPRTKILFTSAYSENAIVHQGVLNEGVVLLQKPFTPFALAQKVREVLDGSNPTLE